MGMNINIVGIGSLGFALMSRFLNEKYNTSVFNRTKSKYKQAIDLGANPLHSINEIINTNITIACLNDAESIISTFMPLLSDKPFFRQRGLMINTSTLGPDESDRVNDFMASINFDYTELPVSGGPEGALKGELIAYVGKIPEKDNQQVIEIIATICKQYTLMENNRHAQGIKVINNYCEAMNMAVAAEAIILAEKIGLKKEKICQSLPMGRGRSAYMDVLLDKYQREDSSISFPLHLRVKDIKLAASLFLATETDSFFYRELQNAYQQALAQYPDRVDQTAYMAFLKTHHH
ncbi:NAD(P)-dependent oxidoreductase [Samsonia erythrinae]|uniref:3-hydroxyisobutyrate dehydrogenase-like beta-hydroxyacid dehydrogenase n=1 Tax=Samsonia erythrinae TaxID=160434 RepID=A0A4R3VNM9_9GAMM|nr:NAD(P)-binding domain-containing protein [Samsonia erythrinae]TCV08615.1 3-hydroxyisobutyrate dehydrogenase-like beta-hydroxyacid dehydrogenase [Samsonia erythrinae]